MKRYFITGLIILAPLALTVFILAFIFNTLTEPFAGMVAAIFSKYGLFNLGGRQLQEFIAQVLVLIVLFVFTVLLGAVTRYFFFNTLLNIWDYTLHKIPIISTIYKTSQEIIQTLFGSKANAFKQVVMVPFPKEGAHAIGFVTKDSVQGMVPGEARVAVFVPTTPNPTSGFLMLYRKEDLVFLDMKVEEAFKYVISCGVVLEGAKVNGAKG